MADTCDILLVPSKELPVVPKLLASVTLCYPNFAQLPPAVLQPSPSSLMSCLQSCSVLKAGPGRGTLFSVAGSHLQSCSSCSQLPLKVPSPCLEPSLPSALLLKLLKAEPIWVTRLSTPPLYALSLPSLGAYRNSLQ